MSEAEEHGEHHVPLTATTFHLLLALEQADSHGYRIMKTVEEQSGGRVVIGPGTIYEAVQRLKNSGLIAESTSLPAPDEDQRRRYYTLTELGRNVLRAESARLVEVADLVKTRKLAEPEKA